MPDFKIDELYADFCKRLRAGYFVMELNPNSNHKLFLDKRSSSLLDVPFGLCGEECFRFVANHIDDEDRGLVGNSIETILMQSNAEFSFLYNRINGEKYTIRCSASRVKNNEPGVKIEGYVLDISNTIVLERMNKKYQDALYEKFYLLPFIGYLKNVSTGQYIAVSKKFLDFIGKNSKEEVVGKTDFDIFDAEKAKRNTQEDKYSLCIERPFGLNETIVDAQGNRKFFQTFRTKYIDSLGREIVFAMSIDLTETHVLLEEKQKLLNKAKEKAEDANKAKTRFLYNISQDIRVPVNSILASTDRALRHSEDQEIVLDSLHNVKVSSRDLLNLVLGISEIVSYQYGKIVLNETAYPLSDFIKELVDEFDDVIKEKKLTIRYDYNGFRNKYAYFDKEKMGKIFRNIISNAIKYTNNGGDIYLRGKQFSAETPGYSKFILTVEDTGVGMSPTFLNNIFGLFERERSQVENGVHGSGLGMAIVKILVEAMKGDIKISSVPNTGTTVELTFVLKNSSKDEVEDTEVNTLDLDNAIKIAQGKKILLVEDNEIASDLSVDLLKEFGFEVDTANNGAVATNIVSRKGMDYYSLIFMTANMPVMDGFEASNELRSMFPNSKTPIICLTSNDLYNFAGENAKIVDCFVSKPLSVEKIQNLIFNYLKK